MSKGIIALGKRRQTLGERLPYYCMLYGFNLTRRTNWELQVLEWMSGSAVNDATRLGRNRAYPSSIVGQQLSARATHRTAANVMVHIRSNTLARVCDDVPGWIVPGAAPCIFAELVGPDVELRSGTNIFEIG
jgi:hypothetical protein